MCTQVPTPLSGGSLRSGEAWRTRQVRRLSAREAKPLSGGGAGRRPAPGESRYISHRHPGDESPLGGTHRAHGCITPQPDARLRKGSGYRARTRRPGRNTLASRDDRASHPALLTTRSSTRSSPAQTKAGRRLRHGGGRRDEREGDANQPHAQQTSSHTTPIQQPGSFEVLKAPSCSPREPQAMSVISGPVWSGEVAVPQRTHQSSPRTVPAAPDTSTPNPSNHAPPEPPHHAGLRSVAGIRSGATATAPATARPRQR
jgi:hypothetical protein